MATVMEFKLSPRAVAALGQYADTTGLKLDAAAEEMILASASSSAVQPEQRPIPLVDMPAKRREFLEELKRTGSVSEACAYSGVSQGLPYGWARSDIDFARAFEQIRAELREQRHPLVDGSPSLV